MTDTSEHTCRASAVAADAQAAAGTFASHAATAAQGNSQTGDTIWQKTKDTLTGQQHRGAAADLGHQTGQHINAAAGKVNEYASSYASEAKSAASEFGQHASAAAQGKPANPGIFEKIKDTLTGSSAPSHEYAAKAGAVTGQYAKQAREASGSYAQDAAHSAQQYASDAYDSAKASASDAYDTARASADVFTDAKGQPSVWSKLKATLTGTTPAADYGATTGQYIRSAAEQASQSAQDAKYRAAAAAGGAADYARDSAYDAKDAAATFAQHAYDSAQGKPQGIVNKLRSLVSGSSHPATAGHQAGEYVRSFADAAGKQASSAKEKIGSTTSDASQQAGSTLDEIKRQAGQAATHFADKAQGKQPSTWDKVKNTVTGHSNDGANAGETAGEYVASAGQYAQVHLSSLVHLPSLLRSDNVSNTSLCVRMTWLHHCAANCQCSGVRSSC